MKTGRRNVMFIHQTLPDAASTANDTGGSNVTTKKRGRPKKVKLIDHQPHQTVVTTPAASSVIKDTTSCTNNSNGVEEVCISPTPLQIDLSPRVNNNNEQNNSEIADSEPVVKDTDSNTVVDHTAMYNGQPSVPSLVPTATVAKRQRIRRSSSSGKLSYGQQVKSVEAGEK